MFWTMDGQEWSGMDALARNLQARDFRYILMAVRIYQCKYVQRMSNAQDAFAVDKFSWRCIATVHIADRNLSISPVGGKCEAHGGINKTVDSIVHAQDRAMLRDGSFVELSVIYEEPRSAIFLGRDDDCWRVIALCRLDEFWSEPPVDVLVQKHVELWTGTIKLFPDWMCTGLSAMWWETPSISPRYAD